MGEFIERLQLFMEKSGINDNQMTVKASLSVGLLGKAKKSGKDMAAESIEKILCAYPELSADWLLTGRGNMCVDGNGIAVSTNEHTCTILYFPEVDASMGNVDFGEENNAPRHNPIEMVLPYFYNAEFAINAYGDSMSPLIKDGQIVLLSKWQENYIEWGKVYLVCTRSHRTIKRLFPVENDDTRIKCVSENSECYPPFNINKEDIQKMYIVRGHISKDTL
jgi:phage repressor protein C with HTH and peptisase S24 domain